MATFGTMKCPLSAEQIFWYQILMLMVFESIWVGFGTGDRGCQDVSNLRSVLKMQQQRKLGALGPLHWAVDCTWQILDSGVLLVGGWRWYGLFSNSAYTPASALSFCGSQEPWATPRKGLSPDSGPILFWWCTIEGTVIIGLLWTLDTCREIQMSFFIPIKGPGRWHLKCIKENRVS